MNGSRMKNRKNVTLKRDKEKLGRRIDACEYQSSTDHFTFQKALKEARFNKKKFSREDNRPKG